MQDSLKRVHLNEMHHDPCSGTLEIDINHAGLYAALSDNSLHLTGDIVESVLGGGGYLDGLLHQRFALFQM